ncbi:MAG TPA: hypothetical protein VL527_12530, partial [Dongiaceae bacterium]|nr:hypothetical protein [Dongiaceae bacterium]
IRAFVASIAVSDALKNGIDEVLQLWKSREDVKALQHISDLVSRSGIHPTKDKGWMRPCPSCKSGDTCVYRWQFEKSSFVPTADNLLLKA